MNQSNSSILIYLVRYMKEITLHDVLLKLQPDHPMEDFRSISPSSRVGRMYAALLGCSDEPINLHNPQISLLLALPVMHFHPPCIRFDVSLLDHHNQLHGIHLRSFAKSIPPLSHSAHQNPAFQTQAPTFLQAKRTLATPYAQDTR